VVRISSLTGSASVTSFLFSSLFFESSHVSWVGDLAE
jgi:hypothetical protein